MSPAITIYSQTYTHKGRAFQVWSYLDDPAPERATMHFALRVEGETVEGLADRADAIRKARERIDELPAKEVEETPTEAPPQASPVQQPLQSGIDPLRAEAQPRPAQLSLFS